MALAQIKSGATIGLKATPIVVEVDLANGLPGFLIVGLPDKSVEEARERVKSAINNSLVRFPNKKIIVNLAPADIRKEGPAYDLPIAVGILLASEQIYPVGNSLFFGELALNGEVRPISGAIVFASMAKEQGCKTLFIPTANAKEASLIEGIEIIPVNNLKQLIAHLRNEQLISPQTKTIVDLNKLNEQLSSFDLCYVAGQEHAKRALEIAAAGRHNLIMTGPPGSGKSMIAKSLITILPPLSVREMLELTKIHSISGLLKDDQPLVTNRPFRSPHHTASAIAVTGGGNWPRPGEISLAHQGVLFLDELPEFPRQVLEVLRQPMEERVINISRAALAVSFPANFMLVAAQNPCPCGYLNDPQKPCICSAGQIQNYHKRTSGPLMDRIDLHIHVPRIGYEKLSSVELSEASANVRMRVVAAQMVQQKRFAGKNILNNSEMDTECLKRFCVLDEAGDRLMKQAVNSMGISGRGYARTLKVARTIADLDNSENILPQHLAEALSYRIKTE